MYRSLFIPSQSSRHRIAALALYRALLKTAQKVPLPESLARSGPVHPVVHLVKKRFAKNGSYTSLRLVYASMAAGYKFLTMFTKGHTSGSPEHTEIVRFLENHSKAKSAAQNKAPRRTRQPEAEPGMPLLTKVSAPNEPIKYAPTFRPQPASALAGERKVPHVASTSEGLPFLRIKKPQPRVLSKSIGKKTKAYQRAIYKILDIEEEQIPAAWSEDNWDRLVEKQMRTELVEARETQVGPLGSYRWSAQLGKVWLENKVENTWADWVARGKALQRIVDQEKVLVGEELVGLAKPHPEDRANGATMAERAITQRRVETEQATLDAVQVTQRFQDPFISDQWAAIARREELRFLNRQNKRHAPAQQSQRSAKNSNVAAN